MEVWRERFFNFLIAFPPIKISQHFIFNGNNYEEKHLPANLKVSHYGMTNVYRKKNQQIATLLQSV